MNWILFFKLSSELSLALSLYELSVLVSLMKRLDLETVSNDCNCIPMALNKRLYYIHSNYVHSMQVKYGWLLAMQVVDDRSDSSARKLFVCLESPNWVCRNRVDWNVVCYKSQRNPIAVNRSDRTVGNAFDSEEHCEVKLPSVYDSIRVEMDIQLIAEFELGVVYIGWNELAVGNGGKSTMELNSVVGMILLVIMLNVELELGRLLRQELNANK